MLKKKYRLTKRKHFNYIYRKGRSAHADILTLIFCFSRGMNIKVGFSVSKKVGNSVVRHRSLRLMREAVKPLIPQMAANHNYIFIARESLPGKSLCEINKAVDQVLRKAGLLGS